MIDAAKAQGVVLMVGHTFEYHSAVWSLREMVQSGALGDLYYLDTARLNLGLYQHDVNVLLDLAPRHLDPELRARRAAGERRVLGIQHAHRRLEDIACGCTTRTRRWSPTST